MDYSSLFGFIFSLIVSCAFLGDSNEVEPPEVYVGIDVAYDDLEEIKMIADKISNYTNIFVIGCTGISYNATKLYDVCEYVYDKGFSFIVYSDMPPRMEWFVCCYLDCGNQWGEKFLGLYAFDEGGGRQLDLKTLRPFRIDDAKNYDDAGDKFVRNATKRLE